MTEYLEKTSEQTGNSEGSETGKFWDPEIRPNGDWIDVPKESGDTPSDSWSDVPKESGDTPDERRHDVPRENKNETPELLFSRERELLPTNDGKWTGESGNSKWQPDPEYIPKKSNPDNVSWEEILKKNKIDGIIFKDGEPDFSEISKGTVEIDDYTSSRSKNFAQADEKLAEKWNKEKKDGKSDWTADDVSEYRHENNLTWHERKDMKTMDLVPSEVHNNISHSGGISESKKLTANKGE